MNESKASKNQSESDNDAREGGWESFIAKEEEGDELKQGQTSKYTDSNPTFVLPSIAAKFWLHAQHPAKKNSTKSASANMLVTLINLCSVSNAYSPLRTLFLSKKHGFSFFSSAYELFFAKCHFLKGVKPIAINPQLPLSLRSATMFSV